jgi:hypothetical protein
MKKQYTEEQTIGFLPEAGRGPTFEVRWAPHRNVKGQERTVNALAVPGLARAVVGACLDRGGQAVPLTTAEGPLALTEAIPSSRLASVLYIWLVPMT